MRLHFMTYGDFVRVAPASSFMAYGHKPMPYVVDVIDVDPPVADAIRVWVEETFGESSGRYDYWRLFYFFEDEQDLLLFKLRWA